MKLFRIPYSLEMEFLPAMIQNVVGLLLLSLRLIELQNNASRSVKLMTKNDTAETRPMSVYETLHNDRCVCVDTCTHRNFAFCHSPRTSSVVVKYTMKIDGKTNLERK